MEDLANFLGLKRRFIPPHSRRLY